MIECPNCKRYREALEVIRDNPRFNNGVEACHIAEEVLREAEDYPTKED